MLYRLYNRVERERERGERQTIPKSAIIDNYLTTVLSCATMLYRQSRIVRLAILGYVSLVLYAYVVILYECLFHK